MIPTSAIMRAVIRSFRDRGTADIFDGADTPAARRACPRGLWKVARRKLDQIQRVKDLIELAVPPGNRLERLRVGVRLGAPEVYRDRAAVK